MTDQATDIAAKGVDAPFILASQSPRRLQLLGQIGIAPDEVLPADIDETNFKNENPRFYTIRMAVSKAAKVADSHQGAFVLGSDTVVCRGRYILPKAEDKDTARACIEKLNGASHRVYTAVALALPHGHPNCRDMASRDQSLKGLSSDLAMRILYRLVETRVKVRHLSVAEIDAYIANTDQWMGKAGGYGIQGSFAQYIKSIQGSYTSIVGLPVYETANLLRGNGYLK